MVTLFFRPTRVTRDSQILGGQKFRTPTTPEPIDVKYGVGDYVGDYLHTPKLNTIDTLKTFWRMRKTHHPRIFSLARSTKLPTGLYILLGLMSSLFNFRHMISGSTTQITMCCRPNVRPTMIFMLDLRQASSVGPTQICS